LTYRNYLLRFFFFLILRLFPLDSKIIPIRTTNGNSIKNTNIKGFSIVKGLKLKSLLKLLEVLLVEELVLESEEFELISLFEGILIELDELIMVELLLVEIALLELIEGLFGLIPGRTIGGSG
jgi:hypothetical protein